MESNHLDFKKDNRYYNNGMYQGVIINCSFEYFFTNKYK
jgi:hypothetical protein